jgi:hypothetical protein
LLRRHLVLINQFPTTQTSNGRHHFGHLFRDSKLLFSPRSVLCLAQRETFPSHEAWSRQRGSLYVYSTSTTLGTTSFTLFAPTGPCPSSPRHATKPLTNRLTGFGPTSTTQHEVRDSVVSHRRIGASLLKNTSLVTRGETRRKRQISLYRRPQLR